MKLAIFVKNTTLHSNHGGLETQNKILCDALVQQGHTVYVFSPSNSIDMHSCEEAGVNYVFIDSVFRMGTFIDRIEKTMAKLVKVVLPFINFSGLLTEKGKSTWEAESVKVFEHYHAIHNFDCVLSQSSAGRGIVKEKNRLAVKVISICHGTILSEYRTTLAETDYFSLFKPYNFLFFLRKLLYVMINFFTIQRGYINHSDRVIAVSNYIKEQLISETYVNPDRVDVIHNAVDATKIPTSTKNSVPGRNVRFVYVGRLVKSKGIYTIIDALKLLDAKVLANIHVDFYGSGADFDAISAYIRHHTLTNVVTLHGQLPYEQVLQELSSYDVFLFPTQRVEGFPMVLVEAMFARLAIIASVVGGVGDAVSHEENGLVVPTKDAGSLAAAIERTATAPHLIKKLADNGYNRAMNEYTVTHMLEAYLACIRKVVGETV